MGAMFGGGDGFKRRGERLFEAVEHQLLDEVIAASEVRHWVPGTRPRRTGAELGFRPSGKSSRVGTGAPCG